MQLVKIKNMILKITKLILIFFVLTTSSKAQTISKLTITDNLSSASRFTLGKAKPAAARDTFYLLTEKGTQVLFYAELTNTDSSSLVHPSLKFTAYKDINGKFEWVDDRVIEVKRDATYSMTAINFFTTGSFKILVTPEESRDTLAQGVFTITK